MPILRVIIATLLMATTASDLLAQRAETVVTSSYEFARPATSTTALDDYVAAPDNSFAWRVAGRRERAGCQELFIDLTSQSWRTEGEVDRTVWKHRLTIIVPNDCKTDTALLFITGGSNRDQQPNGANGLILQTAIATRSVVAELRNVPNQPLSLMGEDEERYEDNLLAASWNRFLATNDPTWIAQLPMTKSAVAAMTAVQEVLEAEAAHEVGDAGDWPRVSKFVVSGASKRGWTTWLAAAVDRRVVGVAPIVIDLLNIEPSMRHHRNSYGAWSKALGDYERQGLADKLGSESTKPIVAIVDPYVYRDRLTMPKCIINASQDEFFLPDSSRYYFDELSGDKYLSYTPSAGHGLAGSNALDTLIAFHASMVHDLPRPTVTWTGDHSATEHFVSVSAKPIDAFVYRAVNAKARDFRLPALGPAFKATKITPDAEGHYRVKVEAPPTGYAATFVRFSFDIGAPRPFRISTPVWVTPDTEPFAGSFAQPQ